MTCYEMALYVLLHTCVTVTHPPYTYGVYVVYHYKPVLMGIEQIPIFQWETICTDANLVIILSEMYFVFRHNLDAAVGIPCQFWSRF